MADPRTTRNFLTTAASLLATMGLGAVLAVVIVHRFGKTASTDGFFAAYAVFQVVVQMAQSLRLTVVARLVERGDASAALIRYRDGGLVVAGVFAVPMLVAAGPTAALLTGETTGAAHDAATTALRLLWVAGAAHLLAALGAAALAAREEFTRPALAYSAGSALAIAGILALAAPLGVDAIGLSLAAGALVTLVSIWTGLSAGGLIIRARVRRGLRERARRAAAAVRVMVVGSVGQLTVQLTFVVTVAFAARLDPGKVTVYTYAYFAAVIVLGTTQGPASMVLAAPVARTWDRVAASLVPRVTAFVRLTLTFVLLVLPLAAMVGTPVIELLLGDAFSPADRRLLVGAFLVLGGMLVGSVVGTLPQLAAFAEGRYGAVAAAALMATGLHVGLSAVALVVDGLLALAAATSLATLAFAGLLLRLVHGDGWRSLAARLAREALVLLTAVTAAFALPGTAALVTEATWVAVLGAGAGTVLYALIVSRALPEHRALVSGIVHGLVSRQTGPRIA